MPINHSFVNPKADGADATIVRPSDWNANLVGGPDLPTTLYDPGIDETMVANATARLDTDVYIIDSGRLITIPSNSILWMDAPRLTGQFSTGYAYNVKDKSFGAVGDNVADDTVAIQDAINAAGLVGGDVLIPTGQYKVTSPLTMSAGVRIIGVGASNKWGRAPNTAIHPVRINYSGTVACLKFAPGVSGEAMRNMTVMNLELDGTGSTGSVDGVLFDISPVGAGIQGVVFENVMVMNFPRSQMYQPTAGGGGSAMWGMTFIRCGFQDIDRSGSGHLVDFQGPVGGASGGACAEVTFDDCIFANHTSGKWCAKIQGVSIRFIGGTVAPTLSGGNGVWIVGGLTVSGTHFEGWQVSGIGIRVSGVTGSNLAPSAVITWTTGIEVGDSTAPTVATVGTFIAGTIGGNTTDIDIIAGGSRRGTVIAAAGDASGTGVVVVDHHFISEGLREVLRLDQPGISLPSGSAGAPYIFTLSYPTTGPWVDQATGDLVWSIAGTERMRLAVSNVALKISAQYYPGSHTTAFNYQTNVGLLGGTGAPADAVGTNGDISLRSDMRAATAISQRVGGIWQPALIYTSCTADFTGTNVNTAQPVFNTTEDVFTAQAATTYIFEGVYHIHTTGTTSHTFGILFGGTATLTSIDYRAETTNAATEVLGATQVLWCTAATAQVLTAATATATHHSVLVKGVVRINVAGTFIPQYIWSAAPGVAGTTLRNSYFKMLPVGVNTTAAVGQWA